MYARDNAATASDGQLPPGEHIATAVIALRMLADPTRLRLMWLLSGREYDVGSLATAVGAARPAVSQHLAKLLLAGLVIARRDGRRAVYHAHAHVRRLIAEAVKAAGPHPGGTLDPEPAVIPAQPVGPDRPVSPSA
jgi:DNA-binding transcriptional ArsR family regulator